MDGKKVHIKDILQTSIVYERSGTSVYLAGSLSFQRERYFNPNLSDIDLFLTAACATLDDYVAHLDQVRQLSLQFNKEKGAVVDLFFMTQDLISSYFACLPVIWDPATFDNENLIFGSGGQFISAPRQDVSPSMATKKQMYIAKALSFSDAYSDKLPVADTSLSRKTAKSILKGLKLIICAKTPTSKLAELERQLQHVVDFTQLEAFLIESKTPVLHFKETLDDAIKGKSIEDWPAWMICQNDMAIQLMRERFELSQALKDQRLYVSLGRVWDMLTLGLKEVTGEVDTERQLAQIAVFADNTASLITRLALGGVDALIDLEDENTPHSVKQGYEVMVKHLRHSDSSLRSLAASVALLEYAFIQTIAYSRKIS